MHYRTPDHEKRRRPNWTTSVNQIKHSVNGIGLPYPNNRQPRKILQNRPSVNLASVQSWQEKETLFIARRLSTYTKSTIFGGFNPISVAFLNLIHSRTNSARLSQVSFNVTVFQSHQLQIAKTKRFEILKKFPFTYVEFYCQKLPITLKKTRTRICLDIFLC